MVDSYFPLLQVYNTMVYHSSPEFNHPSLQVSSRILLTTMFYLAKSQSFNLAIKIQYTIHAWLLHLAPPTATLLVVMCLHARLLRRTALDHVQLALHSKYRNKGRTDVFHENK